MILETEHTIVTANILVEEGTEAFERFENLCQDTYHVYMAEAAKPKDMIMGRFTSDANSGYRAFAKDKG